MIWNEKIETLSGHDLQQLQSDRVKHQIQRIYTHVPFYRNKWRDAGIGPGHINGIRDIARLPFTTKDDLRKVYPYGLMAVDKNEITEIHTSSGTTGTPVVDAYTPEDIEIWSEVMARSLAMGGVNRMDTLQNAFGYGFFTGAMGFHYGTRAIGATLLPISAGNTKRQISTMKDFRSTVLACTPSYALYLAEYGAENGFSFAGSGLKAGFFGAEPWSEKMRWEIEAKLHLKAFDIYGLTEIIGPGVGCECDCQEGLHIFEDHFYPEIIDPESGEQLPDGERGELVLTTLTRHGTPVIRFRTKDITYIIPEPCPCGRTQRRIHRLMGRTDDMLIIRGVNIFPTQIEQVLFKVEGIEPHYQLIVEKKGLLDTLEVQVEMNEKIFSDEISALIEFERKIESDLHYELGIHAKVKLVGPKTIARSEGKAKRIVDKREIKNRFEE